MRPFDGAPLGPRRAAYPLALHGGALLPSLGPSACEHLPHPRPLGARAPPLSLPREPLRLRSADCPRARSREAKGPPWPARSAWRISGRESGSR